jgi:Transposase DDE domain group 1
VALITNNRLKEIAQELLDEARERHEEEEEQKKVKLFCEDLYQAGSWEHERRVIYKAEVMEQGTQRTLRILR